MRNVRIIAALLAVVCLSSHAVNAQESLGTLSQDEARAWREDLRFMAAAMERTHRNLFHSISRQGGTPV